MPIIEPEVIKNIVRANFDSSSEPYERYEKKYGLFRYLTLELAENCGIQIGMNICDIGCGTGTSTILLSKLVGEDGNVTGVDLSENMLKVARSQVRSLIDREPKQHNFENISFIQCDADELAKQFEHNFDAILYNASIFLIPNPKNTLASVFNKLTPGGCVGFNYLIGVFDHPCNNHDENIPSGSDLFLGARDENQPFAPYGRRINDIWAYPKILKEIGFKNIKLGRLSKRMVQDELLAFYSIPAQSAALWPKTEYQLRLENLEALVRYLKEIGVSNYYQHWGWVTAIKNE
jgi:ubiquinone/menaquinone biosynthesis C-methylase UbiE